MPARPPPLSTPHSLHTHLLSFLTLSIHTILHARGLYPENTFLLTRAFNFPVPQNRHPELCAYINSCVSAITPHLQAGTINTVSIVIYSDSPAVAPSSSPANISSSPPTKPYPSSSPSVQVLERYIFNLSSFPSIPFNERFTFLEGRAPADINAIRNIDVEEELRACLRKLAYSASKLEDLKNPEECTWGVVMEMKENEGEGNAPIGHPQRWEPAVAELQIPTEGATDIKGKGKARDDESKTRKESRVGKARGGIKSTAIRAVEVGDFIMEAWIEEGKAKFESRESRSREEGQQHEYS
ncbi:uncharacterized protein EAF02_009995 [Botrytis sinoallii]|uniref:uncharacterized protein n=1 Tax=Botrytis sinoallii TaxID=1463999 RepID=UPI00190060C6|nr:uncharacterized protein EAF02_009995 [Botrytis sinoallii]KAF7865572.1 hypothetical protein EAF02_009995 [Botrytis sinoallii]